MGNFSVKRDANYTIVEFKISKIFSTEAKIQKQLKC
jgi:hypothetical protein